MVIIAHSIGPQNKEIVTLKAEIPKFLLEILRQHKELSITEFLDEDDNAFASAEVNLNQKKVSGRRQRRQ